MTRSASSSIAGYSYQFHESVLRLINVPDESDTITLEGVEDIDVSDECVQVKYLPSQKLLPSNIKKPTSLMLEDYVINYTQRKDTIYRLYAYFGDSSGDAAFLDNDDFYIGCANSLIDSDKKSIAEISDDIRKEFRNKFELLIGEELEVKEKNVRQKLKDVLSASSEEVDLYFYQNAMNFILSRSIKNDKADRTISKKEFLDVINKKNLLFGIWRKIEQGKDAFLKDIKRRLKGEDFRHNKERLVYIDTDFLGKDDTGYDISHLIVDLAEKYSLLEKNDTATPIAIVLKAQEKKYLRLKTYLVDRGVDFNDGYEHIKFSADTFNKEPVINTRGNIAKKIGKTSYEIRLVRIPTYLKYIGKIDKPHTAICFSKSSPFDFENVIQYQVSAVENYKDINNILN